jgi:hypothetical protein
MQGVMRTPIVILVGLTLSTVFVFAAAFLGGSKIRGAYCFLVAWLIFCVFDYSNGVKAGLCGSRRIENSRARICRAGDYGVGDRVLSTGLRVLNRPIFLARIAR